MYKFLKGSDNSFGEVHFSTTNKEFVKKKLEVADEEDAYEDFQDSGKINLYYIFSEDELDNILAKRFKGGEIGIYGLKTKITKRGTVLTIKKVLSENEYGDSYFCDMIMTFNEKTGKFKVEFSPLVYDNKPDIYLTYGSSSDLFSVMINSEMLGKTIEDEIIPFLDDYFKDYEVDMLDEKYFEYEDIEEIVNGKAKTTKGKVIWKKCKFRDKAYNLWSFDFIINVFEKREFKYEVENLEIIG